MRRHAALWVVGAALACAAAAGFPAPVAGQADQEPCCSVKSIDVRSRTVTVTEKATGCTLEFGFNDPDDVRGLKVGAALALDVRKLKVASDGKMSSTGQASSSAGGTTGCGSNVGRYAQTKTCYVQGKDGKWVSVPCTK